MYLLSPTYAFRLVKTILNTCIPLALDKSRLNYVVSFLIGKVSFFPESNLRKCQNLGVWVDDIFKYTQGRIVDRCLSTAKYGQLYGHPVYS